MRKLGILVGLFFSTCVTAGLIDFEEDNWTLGQLVGTYDGVTFSTDWQIWDNYSSSSYPQGSGTDAIYSHNFGGAMNFNEIIDLNSLWLASVDVGQVMYFQGFDVSNNLLYTSSNYAGGFIGTVDLGWSGVQSLTMSSTSFNHFILDDIDYSNSAVIVSEPSSFALLLLSLIGFRIIKARS